MRNYRNNLLRLEPPLTTPGTYRIAYRINTDPVISPLRRWMWEEGLDLWSCWYLCRVNESLGREVRIQDMRDKKIYGTECALLNLFSNSLTDRFGK